MIYTVTLNPAIDKTIVVNHFTVNQVNRAQVVREDAGGKGINVSKMIKNLKGNSIAFGICAGSTGNFIQTQMDAMGLKHCFVSVSGQTRTNIKIVDERLQTYTDLNESGMPIPMEALNTLEETLFGQLQQEDILVLSGSVPENVPVTIYQKWIEMAKALGTKVILDADRELLQMGVTAGPYMIKPNMAELQVLVGEKIRDREHGIVLAKSILGQGVQVIVLSLGEAGCVVITELATWRIPSIDVAVKSTVGAGDAMVGALAYALDQNQSLEEGIALGVAASTASIMRAGTLMGTYEEVYALRSKVSIKCD